MRILQTYAGNLYGGIERLLVSLADATKDEKQFGIKSEFSLCFPGRLSKELEQAGCKPFDLGAVRLSRPWTVLAARRRLSQLLRKTKFDLVITHACWIHAVLAPRVKRHGVPLVNWVHDTLRGKVLLERLAAMTPPDLIIANSIHSSQAAQSVFSRTRNEVIHYPLAPSAEKLSLDERRSIRTSLHCPEHAVVVLQASRLERWKGHAVLLDSLARLKERCDWVCWIAGGPQRSHEHAYFAELHAQSRKLGIADRVQFLGQRSDIAQLMQAADIFCQPNTGPEPFGVVFIEALYAGLPVISSNYGGAAEIVTDKCGILTTPNDPVSVSRAISEVLENEGRRRVLAADAPLRAADLCDPARQMWKLAQVLGTVCKNH